MSDVLIATLVTYAAGSGGLAVAVAELDRRDRAVTVAAEPVRQDDTEDQDDDGLEAVGDAPEVWGDPLPGRPIPAAREDCPTPSIPWAERWETWHLSAHADYLRADEDCRGNLLSLAGMRAGVDAFDLWQGSAADAYRHASRELRDWWAINGRRSPIAMLGGARAAAGRKTEFDSAGAR